MTREDEANGRPAWRRSFEMRGLIPTRNPEGRVDRRSVGRWLLTVLLGVALAVLLFYFFG